MKRLFTSSIFTAALLLLRCAAFGQGAVSAVELRCEYLVDPLGIDVEQPRLSWVLAASQRGQMQSAYQIVVASTMASLEKDTGDLWDSKQVHSGDTAQAAYAGRPLTTGMQCYWKVRVWDAQGGASGWSKPAFWSMGLLREADWSGRFIGSERPAGVAQGAPLSFPWLRKTFVLRQKPQRATVYVNPLGYFELCVNGKKVGDDVLSPAVSDYSKRTFYVTYDVTGDLVAGSNCVALWLGRGWYVRGHPGVIHDGPMVRAQMDILLPDGATEKVGTDETWKAHASPIKPVGRGTAFGDYGGEHYDARLELNSWNAVGLDDSDWLPAAVFSPPAVTTSAQMVQPNRIMRTLTAAAVTEDAPGACLIDFGRNFVGWFELPLPADTTAGRNIRLEYSDSRPSGGDFMTANQRDEYVTRAGAGQVIRERFNYHGFQYVHITGLERQPAPADIKGSFIRTAYEPAAAFECSSDLLNRIWRMVTWTYENLTLGGYVVDCPTRERLGYGGDAGTSLETGLFNFDTSALYTKWMANWRDAQRPNGDLPYTAPAYPEQGGGGPMWCGFTVTLPWQLYLQYSDKRILEISFPYMQQWLAFLDTKTVDGVLEPYISYGITPAQWNFLGDWVTPNGSRGTARDLQSTRFINNCHYLYQLQIAAKIAAVLGKKDEASQFENKASALAKRLHERFFDATRRVYVNGAQACQAFPLLLNMVPAEMREPVMKNLEEAILATSQGHLDTGMHGTYFLLKYLMEADRNDLISTFTSQTNYPSWGDVLRLGGTTMWENWNGGSHIHDTLISIGSWFIQGVGGIQLDEKSPGFSHFYIKPAVVGGLTFARASYRSIRGQIRSNWRIENSEFHLDVTVPPGTTATVYVPTSAPAAVTEGGKPVAQSAGVRPGGVENGKALFTVDSGEYAFAAPLARPEAGSRAQ
jgi:alpha-L-rhamnosidase